MPTRIYVGDLGDRGKRSEIEREFGHYGHVSDVWVARNPPGFAFVFMESHREAEGAVRNLDGANMCGVRVKVELAKGPEKGEKMRNGPKCYECGRVGHPARECTRRPGYIYQGRHSRDDRRSRSRSKDRPSRRSRDDFYSQDRRSRSPERRRSRSRSKDRGRRYEGRGR